MLDRRALESHTEEFNLYQVEKDYLQHIVLRRLYQSFSNEIIFKGGTALQKAYNMGRFSEDLDFTAGAPAGMDAIAKKIETVFNGLNDFCNTTHTATKDQRSLKYRLKMEGPLHTSSPQSMQSIIIDISLREKALMQPAVVPISPTYLDIGNYVATVMDIREMLAEKVRTIMTRRSSRDLYDIYFILSKRVRLDIGIANKKLSYYNMQYSKKEFLQRAEALEKVWNRDIGRLMKTVPDFRAVFEYVSAAID